MVFNQARKRNAALSLILRFTMKFLENFFLVNCENKNKMQSFLFNIERIL